MDDTNIRQPDKAPEPDSSPLIDYGGTRQLQEISGVLLFYDRAIYYTMIVELGTLESYQTKGTQATDEAINQILNYCVTHPNAQIHFFASNMYVYEQSDASYISKPEARSRAGGYLFLI